MSLEGQQLGEFEILERLGQGGMGAVYKARQTKLRRLVALKTLQSSLADDPEYIARFEQEAIAAAGLNHPNLVQVHSAGENDGLYWFAMEYVEGESAKGRLKRKGRIEPLEAIAIAIHVATALEYGWRKAQLIHRDIKPDNIFLSEDGEVKLGDLGLAKSAGQTQGLTVTGHSMGTPHYISPEQVEAMKSVDLRADIYSLGCTLYHMLSGQVPFDGNSAVSIMMKHVTGPVPHLKDAWPQCHQVLNDVVGKMMQKDPALRQQDYGEVIGDLRRAYDAMTGESVPAVVAVTQQKPAPPKRPQPTSEHSATSAKSKVPFTTGIGLGLLLLVVGSFFFFKAKEAKRTERPTNAEHDISGSIRSVEDKWHDLLAEQRSNGDLKKWATDQQEYVVPKNAGIDIYSDPAFHARNSVIRATWANDYGLILQLRVLRDGNGKRTIRYDCRIENEGVRAFVVDYPNGKYRERLLKKWSLPSNFNVTKKHTAEFRVFDDLFQFQIDGVEIGAIRDQTIDEAGDVGFSTPEAGWIYSVNYMSLDPTPQTTNPAKVSDSPASAAKESPFVNSLGMKFVPVPGTKVLFSIWDTRVQDYKAYVAVNKVDDSWTKQEKDGVPVSRETDYPVVGVNWEDAQAFCQWLTEKEIAEGKLPNGLKYRLPTDEEWSWAAGMPPELGTTPAEKSQEYSADFPWGKDYPPTKKVGNYADETFHAKFLPNENAKDEWNKNQWIAGYTDGYATTSPVGSFPANAYGLYDMGGNVWQWCEDWFDASHKDRVLRGAAWDDYERANLLSKNRHRNAPTHRFNNYGVRCVLELPQK